MLALPTELAMMVGERLSSYDVARLSRASRAHQAQWEPLLYRLYGVVAVDGSRRFAAAVAWVVNRAAYPEAHQDPNKDAQHNDMCALAEAALAKVERFCQLRAGDLDGGSGYSHCHLHLMSCIYKPELLGQPLHMAARKGLDGIVAWLLRNGADVHAPLRLPSYPRSFNGPPPYTSALNSAVSESRVSTARLLLAHGAHLGLKDEAAEADASASASARLAGRSALYQASALHQALRIGHDAMAELLLKHASGHHRPSTASPSELLSFYIGDCSEDMPAAVALLLRQGAQYSKDVPGTLGAWGGLGSLLLSHRWEAAWEMLASPAGHAQMTASRADSMMQTIMYGQHPRARMAAEKRVIQRLLDLGADPNAGGKLLFKFASRHKGRYPVVLELLPPFLEAGMALRQDAVDPPSAAKKKRKRGGARGRTASTPVDFLGAVSSYEVHEDKEGQAAKLDIVHLLLQHGAPIQGATRGDALDAYDGKPDGPGADPRAAWAQRLCCVVLDHCRSTPPDQQGDDMRAFLRRHLRCEEGAARPPPELAEGL